MGGQVRIQIVHLGREVESVQWLRAECPVPSCRWMLEGRDVLSSEMQLLADSHLLAAH